MIAQTTYRVWLIRHTAVFSCISVSVLAASMLSGPGTTDLHLKLLIVLLPFLGIPHGALDYNLAKHFLGPRLGRAWAIQFLAVYLFIMGIVLVAWWVYPTASFVAFLALTVYHFGTGDVLATPAVPLWSRIAEILGRGGLLLTLPTVFYRQEILQLFSYLIPETSAHNLISMLAGMLPFIAVCLIICLLWSLYEFFRRKDSLVLLQAIELVLLTSLFCFLPPLLAFTVYFCFLHSIRHMLYLSANKNAGSELSALGGMLRTAMPVTAATLVLGATTYFTFSGVAFDMPLIVRVVFIGIASMTYPHALLIALAGHAGAIRISRDLQYEMNVINSK